MRAVLLELADELALFVFHIFRPRISAGGGFVRRGIEIRNEGRDLLQSARGHGWIGDALG